jgi:N-methylhydantoinase A
VPEQLRFGVSERVSAQGEQVRSVHPEELNQLVKIIRDSNADSIAISLLFSFANPQNEEEVAAALESLGLPLSISHKILPEFREFERASTVVANAYLAPKMGTYLERLTTSLQSAYTNARLEVMQSSGGIISSKVAAAEPVRTALSGPAGGVVGAFRLASLAGFDRIIGFDMGGTSTDVCLIESSTGLRISNESVVAGLSIGIPMLDIHTAGAGGGSIARFDAGGMLRVGPQSAGSLPGPICFGRGELPTVTDANLLLGRLDAETFLGGAVKLDLDRTREWMDKSKGGLASAEQFAAGILQVIETSMAKAIRVISIEKGFDPRDFTLVAFGGGGPVHACQLARSLRVPRVLVPILPGALSAVGILLADTTREYSRTVMVPIESQLHAAFDQLESQGAEDFRAEGLEAIPHRSVDLRYKGQGYELNVPYSPEMASQFHQLHKRRYGFADESRAIEVVNVRVRVVAPAEAFEHQKLPMHEGDGSQAKTGSRPVYFDGSFQEAQVYNRELLRPGDTFSGPAIVTEYSSATILPPGDVLHVEGFSNLVIEVR